VTGITFFRHIKSQNIAKPDNLKIIFERKNIKRSLTGKSKFAYARGKLFFT
jgi:hypothetical protein